MSDPDSLTARGKAQLFQIPMESTLTFSNDDQTIEENFLLAMA